MGVPKETGERSTPDELDLSFCVYHGKHPLSSPGPPVSSCPAETERT